MPRFAEPAKRYRERKPNERFTIGFVGRVCPIKDVRTLVAAMRVVKDKVPDVLVRVLGPMGEDPEYAEECQKLAKALDLEENIRFEGRVAVHEEMPKLDLLVLTSISEAQPLVILEGGAVGLPIVATDVGSCAELLNGRTPEDRAIGVAGLITPIASPGKTGRAVLELWADDAMRLQMGKSLQERVSRFYDQQDMIDSYRAIYETHIQAKIPLRDRCGTEAGDVSDESVAAVVENLSADGLEDPSIAYDDGVDPGYERVRVAEQVEILATASFAMVAEPGVARPSGTFVLDEARYEDVAADEQAYVLQAYGTEAQQEVLADPLDEALDYERCCIDEQWYVDGSIEELQPGGAKAWDELRRCEQATLDQLYAVSDLSLPQRLTSQGDDYDSCRRAEQREIEIAFAYQVIAPVSPAALQRASEDLLAADDLSSIDHLLREGPIAATIAEARDVAVDDAPSLRLEGGALPASLSIDDGAGFGDGFDFDDEDFELVEDLFDSFEQGGD